MQNTVKEHYVPQFYLKNFTNEKGLLYVYDLVRKALFTQKPKNICYEKNLYETKWENANPKLGNFVLQNDIEKTFCGYESDYARVLTKILKVCSPYQNPNALILHKNEKDIFFRFVVNLIVRHPHNMDELSLNEIDENNDVISRIRSLLDDMGLGGTESLCYAVNKKVMLTYEFENSFPYACLEALRKLDYTFFYAEKGCFITSDSPVCVGDDPIVVDDDKTSIYLALSPKVAVILGNYPHGHSFRNRMLSIDKNKVESFNSALVKHDDNKHFLIGTSENYIKKYVIS